MIPALVLMGLGLTGLGLLLPDKKDLTADDKKDTKAANPSKASTVPNDQITDNSANPSGDDRGSDDSGDSGAVTETQSTIEETDQ